MIRAIIIDDIDNSRLTLAHDLKHYCPQISIIGEADSVKTGIEVIKKYKPDVIFLDIQLGDGTGFNILEQLENIDFKIIFTTALDSYGIKAIKFSALDYLLKPIDPEELVAAVEKLDKRLSKDDISDNISVLLENLKDIKPSQKRIALSSTDKIHMVYVNDITRCESKGNYTLFYLTNKDYILVTRTLKEFDILLEEYSFIRVHHSHLINLSYLKEYVKSAGGWAIMKDNTEIPVSFRKKDKLLKMMGVK